MNKLVNIRQDQPTNFVQLVSWVPLSSTSTYKCPLRGHYCWSHVAGSLFVLAEPRPGLSRLILSRPPQRAGASRALLPIFFPEIRGRSSLFFQNPSASRPTTVYNPSTIPSHPTAVCDSHFPSDTHMHMCVHAHSYTDFHEVVAAPVDLKL